MLDESKYRAKRITDPVHGTIGLSELEIELLSTQAFQRLRNVKQLGLAHLVFPAADYSRLSHSIGVSHVTGRILNSLARNTGQEICDGEYELYRLAGLMHDVGHYPFSHTFENAVSTFYQNRSQPRLFEEPSEGTLDNTGQPTTFDGNSQIIDSLNHEDVGRLLLEADPEINDVLSKYSIDPKPIHNIFSRHSTEAGTLPRFANLISSDLDADRIDYLSRTAQHTGLPYGSVDTDYLLNQMELDDEDQICLNPSALRTVEHFLLGRYFDYQQVNFHKTVAALEWALHDVINEMLQLSIFDCSPTGIQSMVANGRWYGFDDFEILRLARELENTTKSDVMRAKIHAVTRRIPPKLIGSFEFLGDRSQISPYNLGIQFMMGLCDQLSNKFDIHRELWHVWGSWKMSFTKVGAYLPASTTLIDSEDSADAIAQIVRIKDGAKSKPISEIPRSLMSVLSQNALFSARLYVILRPEQETLRSEITNSAEKEIQAAVGLEYWVRGE